MKHRSIGVWFLRPLEPEHYAIDGHMSWGQFRDRHLGTENWPLKNACRYHRKSDASMKGEDCMANSHIKDLAQGPNPWMNLAEAAD